MRILHLADLHLEAKWFDWVGNRAAEYDLVVLAGDLLNMFSNVSLHDQARACGDWLLALPVPTVVCSGNHDYWVSDPRAGMDAHAEGQWLRSLRGRGRVVGADGDIIDHAGLRIAINGWLQLPEGGDGVDVVVTHAPPVGCKCAADSNGRDHGDPELWDVLRDAPPRLVLAGHIHRAPVRWARWSPMDGSTLVLVPGNDEESDVPAHWVLDIDGKLAVHSDGTQVEWP